MPENVPTTETEKEVKPIDKKVAKRVQGEIGATGTVMYAGIISQEEYNRKLEGVKGLRVYDEMRRGDGSVAAALKIVKLPIISTEWYYEPASDSEDDKMVADFFRQITFEEMTLPFDDFLRGALGMLEFGHAVFEPVYKIVQYLNNTYIGLEKMAWRKQTTIEAWELTDGRPGIRQLIGDGRHFEIPMDRLCVFTHEREGDNLEGISLLRPIYKHWYMKDGLYKIDAIAAERQGVGVPKLTVPAGASKDDKATARRIAQNQRANEKAYLEMPEGFDVEFMDMHAQGNRSLIDSISHHDLMITKAVLAQFLNLGSGGSGGSYSLGKDQSRLFMQAEDQLAKYIASVWNSVVVDRVMKLNFNGMKPPKIKFQPMNDQDIQVMSNAVATLVNADVITMEPKTEVYVRQVLNLPKLTVKEIEDIKKKRQQDAMENMAAAGPTGEKDPKGDVKDPVEGGKDKNAPDGEDQRSDKGNKGEAKVKASEIRDSAIRYRADLERKLALLGE